MYLNKRFIYVNSNNRTSGTHTNFTYNLDIKTFGDFDSVCLIQANIPKSYYLIEAGENTFTLQEDVNDIKITIPPANYTRSSLRTVVENLLNTNSVLGITYTITVPTSTEGDTGKFTFGCTGNMIQPALIFGDYVFEQLGFNQGSTNNFVADTLVSTNVIKLQLEDSIFIHSSMVDNGSDDILQDIFAVDNPSFSNITWICPSLDMFSKKILRPETTTQFRITDEAGNDIDTNGINCVFTLIIYKSEDVGKLLKRVLKLNLLESL